MNKKTQKKKKNYRLRRSVRRTLGALFMISAIIIAAIPFPEAAASEENPPSSMPETNRMNYKVENAAMNSTVNLSAKGIDIDDPTELLSAYSMIQDASGKWIYREQFTYYLLDGTTNAIIYKYNNPYFVEKVTLKSQINNGNYAVVDEEKYTSYFTKSDETHNITLRVDATQAEKDKFKYYFPEKYNEYTSKLKEYTTALKNYQNNPQQTEPNPDDYSVQGDPTIDLDINKRGEFYCDYVFESRILYGKGCKMVYAQQPTNDPAQPFKAVYVAQSPKKGTVTDTKYSEEEGTLFLYNSLHAYDLVGIGNGAFQGVTTSVTLELPSSILYIGDDAFEGSYVNKIIITNVAEIGNRAFANSQLTELQWNTATKKIGTEAFRNTNLTKVQFPYSVEEIGEGAFSYNENLKTISFDTNTTISKKILDFAFYNCPMMDSIDLSKEKISFIGEGAFALDKLETGQCTKFVFPTMINSGDSLGDYILAGRMNMKQVTMPSQLGYNLANEAKLKSHIFENCVSLEYVEFPDENYSCGYVSFDKYIFSSVTNPNFYVKGPELASGLTIAMPRRSTWSCTMADGSAVPYVYMSTKTKEQIYEVSQEGYLMSIDSKGILRSCNFMDIKNNKGEETPDGIIDKNDIVPIPKLTIPGQVGNIQVTAIANGCFEKAFLEEIQELEIADGGALKKIENNVFAGATKMKSAYIGDSVEIIGDEAFNGNTELEKVTIGKSINKIGARAFKGCRSLTEVEFKKPENLNSFPLSNIGEDAFNTYDGQVGSSKLTFTGEISPNYAPFAWAMQPDNYVDSELGIRVCYKTPEPTNLTVVLDNRNNYPTLVNYPHYETLKNDSQYGDLISKYETGGTLTPAEEALVKASLNVIVPEGVQSIDAQGYFTETSKKIENEDPYAPTSNAYTIKAYFDQEPYTTYEENGLFKEDENIEQITLKSVKYLPDEVFDDCVNLDTVQIGKDLEEIKELPFIGCDALTGVKFENTRFVCNNGIIYDNNGENGKTLVECLTSRGLTVGSSTVDGSNDPDLYDVKEIKKAAFKECENITSFDLTGVSSITRIPDACFQGCNLLNTVDLPPEVRKIGDEAFATGSDYLAVTVRGREVGLGDKAFGSVAKEDVNVNAGEKWDKVKKAYLISYEDSAVRSDAASQGADTTRTLDESYTFKFYDEKGVTLLKIDYVEAGGTAQPPEESEIPKITGKKFTGWNRSLKNITEDGFALAVYEDDETGSDDDGSNDDGSNDDNSGSNNNGNNGSNGNGSNGDADANGNKLYTLTVKDGLGSGKYPAGTNITITASRGNGGTPFGYWSTSNNTVIFDDRTKSSTTITMPSSDATVVANYVGQYRLEVEYGSGSGSYAPGAKVTISAVEPPSGKKFSKWTTKTNGLNVENSTEKTTTITMPASDAKITATYINTGTTSGNTTSGSSSQNGTTVNITKPGISDKDKASAYVSGSSDNFVVKISESLVAADEVQQALAKEYPDMTRIKYFAMDITLYDATGRTKITNTSNLKVNITIPIPDELRAYGGNNKAGAVVDGSLEKLNAKFTTINGVPSISFTATHFSPYTIYVDTGNITVGSTLDETPKTGDGIHPKWFLSLGLACISLILFMKKDTRYRTRLS